MNKKINISAIVPVYNEEKIVKETIENLKKELGRLDLNYEILVVNDASTDKTREVLEKISEIKIINHPYNKGYGAALKTGVSQGQNDLILIIDADNTYPSNSIPELVKHAPNYDMVVGARTGKKVKIPLIRKPAKWTITN